MRELPVVPVAERVAGRCGSRHPYVEAMSIGVGFRNRHDGSRSSSAKRMALGIGGGAGLTAD